MVTARSVLAIGATALVVVSGCGGRSDAPANPKPTPRLTQAQYVAAGNKICRATIAKAPGFPGRKVGDRYDSTPDLMSAYLLAVQNLMVQANDGLKILRPPSTLKAAHKEVLAAQDARITELGLAINAVATSDMAGLNDAVRHDVAIDGPRYRAAATAAGLSACGGPSSRKRGSKR